jgi:hypothetical protein
MINPQTLDPNILGISPAFPQPFFRNKSNEASPPRVSAKRTQTRILNK